MARPRLNLNVVQVKKLAEIQCTMSEIASVMDCSVNTLETGYLDIIKAAREGGKSSLRRAQWKKALEGNPALLIWLGKHYLEQKEMVTLSSNSEPEVRKLVQKWESAKFIAKHGSTESPQEQTEQVA